MPIPAEVGPPACPQLNLSILRPFKTKTTNLPCFYPDATLNLSAMQYLGRPQPEKQWRLKSSSRSTTGKSVTVPLRPASPESTSSPEDQVTHEEYVPFPRSHIPLC
jgi:hypothetical protein